jgi:long-chain acyl-CoA synthetase
MAEPLLSIHEATAQMTASGQIFEMEEVSVRGVTTRAWKHAPRHLKAVLDLSLNHADKDFIVYEDERYSFERHFRYAATVAHRLQEAGVERGDRVAIAARNLPEWAFFFWGTMAAGAIAVPLNAWWTGDELAYGLRDSGTKVVLVDEDRLERIRPHLDELPSLTHVIVVSEHRGVAPDLGASHPTIILRSSHDFIGEMTNDVTPPDVVIDPDDDATIFYTSGTTGSPKGVVGTHRNAVTNIMNLFFVGQRSTLRFGGGNVDAEGRNIQNSYLLTIPLFHATGCLAVMTVNLASGGKLVMMHHFDAGLALALIANERITTFGGVPTIAMQILDHPDFHSFDTSSVRSVSYGGAPSPPELVRRIREAFPVGQPGNGYGLTETSAAVALNSGPDYVAKPTSCGPAIPVNDVAIVPEDFDGDEPTSDLPSGPDVTGELWIKGPNVVRGYWNKPEATAATFTKGWLHSGDVARIDEDGFIHIVDRAKDMIIRGGENIFCTEVEAALFEHPDVADCAVIGVPHPVLGEEVGAVIVLRPGRKVDPEDLIAHAAHRLSRFMVPSHIFFRRDPLPRNPAGKVLKRALRDEVTTPS